MKSEFDPKHAAAHEYTKKDWQAVDSPEIGAGDLGDARPFADVFPKMAERLEKARRGRPPSDTPKVMVSMRLDRDLVERLRASGRGWQTRANAALRKDLGLSA